MVPNLQKIFVQTICKKTITMLKIESCELSFEKISKFSFTENFWSETKIRKTPHCAMAACWIVHSVEITILSQKISWN